MAIYHFSGQIIGRSAGRSATAAAAYRAGQKIADRTTGEVHDYTRKSGVHGASILAPSHAPAWVFDRAELWNQVEESETRVNSQLAREFDVAIPVELNDHDRIELVYGFVQEQFVDEGMICDVCFHDFKTPNPHFHGSLPTREITPDGFGKKRRDWNSHALMERWRKAWADHSNAALEKAGFDVRIDHRSYEDQGIDLTPTEHMGPAVAALEKRGIPTRIGDHNRRVTHDNAEHMDALVTLDVEHQDKTAVLDTERSNVLSEIERIRKEALAQPSTSGIIHVSDHRNDIADRADKEASRFKTGMAASLADQYKARLFLKAWNTELDPSLLKHLKWVDVELRALTLKTGEQIVDRGNTVSLSKGSDDAISAAISMAKAKGWESARVSGSDDFQVRSALALQEAGIEPELTSETAKERFFEEMRKRTEPVVEPKPKPETESDPKPEIDLEKLVRVAAGKKPLPPTNAFRDDTRKLRTWARAVWDDLVANGELEGLVETFVQVMEEEALMAGYSPHEIKNVGLNDSWSKTMSDQKQKPASPRPAAKTRRTWYPDSGQKPPGT